MDADQENVVSAAFGLCSALLGAGIVPGSLGMLLFALLPSCCGRIFSSLQSVGVIAFLCPLEL